MKVSQIMNKFNSTEDRVSKIQTSKEREQMFKIETLNLKRFEKEVALKRLNNQREYHKEKIMNDIRLKMERAEYMQEQKEELNSKRKEVSEQVNKQKIDVMEKFDKILKKNRGIKVKYLIIIAR